MRAERDKALETASETHREIAALQVALRDAAKAVNRAVALASAMQRDGQDLEAVNAGLAPEVRGYLDGRLLQRTGYIVMIGNEVALKMRQLLQGTRDLEKDCADFPECCQKADAKVAAIAAHTESGKGSA